MNEIRNRIKALRLEMMKCSLDAYYISGTDPHLSEYLPERWKTRAFISGFTGSAGMVAITQEEAGLWTDSRYFLQATEQLKGSGIKMFKLRVAGSVSPEIWLSTVLSAGSKVGCSPKTHSVANFRKLKNTLNKKDIQLIETDDLLDNIWEDRPANPNNEIFELTVENAGLSRKEKREQVVAELKKEDADLHIVSSLDELAWLINLRGSDIRYNPVFTGYGATGKNESYLFVDTKKIPADLAGRLKKEKTEVLEYDDFYSWLKSLRSRKIYIDPATANHAIFQAIQAENIVKEGHSIISSLKAVKNQAELNGFKEAMRKDGAALVHFLYWLKNNIAKENLTEYSIGLKLAEFRSIQTGFIGESFAPIVGYLEHGAVVHYSATPEIALPVKAEGILLFDSGGQYLHGTTDITRTVALGKTSANQRKDFTLVLKGMIALSKAVFPEGTKGFHLDVLARKALWENGLNYGHGTGHGVGHFSNVHEGPVSIRQEFNEVPIKTGMVISNEPGIYRENEYGIRIENLIVCVEKAETEYGRFLGFDTLTLCPIDTSLIENELLETAERNWLNDYQQKVYQELKPLLPEELQSFLKEITLPV